jgi:hypothetical protein
MDDNTKLISFTPIFKIEADDDNELLNISSLAVSNQGTLFIADAKQERLLAYSRKGKFIRIIASQGDGPGEINDLFFARLLWDDDGKLLVLDTNSGKLSAFSEDGAFINVLRIPPTSISGIKELYPWKHGYLLVASANQENMFFTMNKKGQIVKNFAHYLPLSKNADKEYFVKQAKIRPEIRRIPKICVDWQTESIYALDPMEYRILLYDRERNVPRVVLEHTSDCYPHYLDTKLFNGKIVRVRRSGNIHISKDFIFISFINWDSTDEITCLDVFSRETGKCLANLNVTGSLRLIDKEERFYFATEEMLIVSKMIGNRTGY